MGTMVVLALAPFIAIMVSSFLKIVVVIFLVRNALGIQQIPPNMAVNGLAIILSIYIMAPVGADIQKIISTIDTTDLQNPITQQALKECAEPIRYFLKAHSEDSQRNFFARTTQKLWPPSYAETITDESLLILLPAFTLTELKEAFEIGFLLYLPFLVIDLIISNILLAMGMMMVSPLTMSLPFKLLLFVLVDGWTRLIHGLVLSYQ
jgi:type III secretion protein R